LRVLGTFGKYQGNRGKINKSVLRESFLSDRAIFSKQVVAETEQKTPKVSEGWRPRFVTVNKTACLILADRDG